MKDLEEIVKQALSSPTAVAPSERVYPAVPVVHQFDV